MYHANPQSTNIDALREDAIERSTKGDWRGRKESVTIHHHYHDTPCALSVADPTQYNLFKDQIHEFFVAPEEGDNNGGSD